MSTFVNILSKIFRAKRKNNKSSPRTLTDSYQRSKAGPVRELLKNRKSVAESAPHSRSTREHEVLRKEREKVTSLKHEALLCAKRRRTPEADSVRRIFCFCNNTLTDLCYCIYM